MPGESEGAEGAARAGDDEGGARAREEREREMVTRCQHTRTRPTQTELLLRATRSQHSPPPVFLSVGIPWEKIPPRLGRVTGGPPSASSSPPPPTTGGGGLEAMGGTGGGLGGAPGGGRDEGIGGGGGPLEGAEGTRGGTASGGAERGGPDEGPSSRTRPVTAGPDLSSVSTFLSCLPAWMPARKAMFGWGGGLRVCDGWRGAEGWMSPFVSSLSLGLRVEPIQPPARTGPLATPAQRQPRRWQHTAFDAGLLSVVRLSASQNAFHLSAQA